MRISALITALFERCGKPNISKRHIACRKVLKMNIQWDAEKYTDDFSFVHRYGDGVTGLLENQENMPYYGIINTSKIEVEDTANAAMLAMAASTNNALLFDKVKALGGWYVYAPIIHNLKEIKKNCVNAENLNTILYAVTEPEFTNSDNVASYFQTVTTIDSAGNKTTKQEGIYVNQTSGGGKRIGKDYSVDNKYNIFSIKSEKGTERYTTIYNYFGAGSYEFEIVPDLSIRIGDPLLLKRTLFSDPERYSATDKRVICTKIEYSYNGDLTEKITLHAYKALM